MSGRLSNSAHIGVDNYIGASIPRSNAKRLLAGRGEYVDDISLPRLTHAAFLRSPYSHARISRISIEAAKQCEGVVSILTGEDISKIVKPYVGVLTHIKGMCSAPQYPMAVDVARWQGEPIAIVIAESRAQAEDALQAIEVEWEELQPVTDPETALDANTPLIHAELGSNLCHERLIKSGDVDSEFEQADFVIEDTFEMARHTAVSLEPRSILADFNPAENHLTVWHSTQVPYMMQWVLAHHFDLSENQVRVIAPDVGGSFGLKIHIYGDEMAAVAAALILGRPVKFVADRLESFLSDVHARGHRVKARIAVSRTGEILGFDVDDLYGIGPYSIYPRGGVNEGIQVTNLVGAPYKQKAYRARCRVVFQNKAMYGQYRAVGHPIACAVTEGLIDRAADAVGMDPVDFRRQNYIGADAYPHKIASGLIFENLSQHEVLNKLLKLMDYDTLKRERDDLRKQGIYRGIGIANFVENSNPSSATYGQGGASIAAQDACTIKLTATGGILVSASINEFGQGAHAVVMQIAATAVGVPIERVKAKLGDTDSTPYGGGNWGSRGTGIGGEAVFQAGRALRANILQFVARLENTESSLLDISNGNVVSRSNGEIKMTLENVARTAYFRTDNVPKDYQPELMVTRSYAQKSYPGIFTNGMHASYLEVDIDTGFVSLIKHWVVDDCGTVINPMLVDEQLRGGVVQGIGGALLEQCLYSPEGQLMNGSLIDYLVPMACEMPEIEIDHVCTPTETSELGAKGAGEAGTVGAAAAIMNAINDALKPFGARLTVQPFTPERILDALSSNH
ncbi:MAG: xanthine dehydrogenase family protein molybdopterin-binding subunit [Rhizobacter sp.]|nr:xanthine dehydrogenase family protein molybdopterin-binding subunit [Rhizobacter sp.]